MATTIKQQVAMDEALVPSTQRLRIGRSNFRLPSDIESKELTLQLIYDVLRRCPFFKAFLVTADVPEIYMQEFWATTNFCGLKGIKREFSVPRTPQQNGIAERKNRTLIEAARTLLTDSLLHIPFWTEAVNNACYVQNRNKNKDALVDGNEHDNDIQKSVSPDIHSSSSGFRDLNAEFEECTNNSCNGVNAASFSVSTSGHNFINNTNDFSAAGPSNTAASPTVANSSSQDAPTSSHDSDMPNLEDLTHSDDAVDVGAEDDINNLESIISVSPILTTRIHKDHPTPQIIGDLSSTTHTKVWLKQLEIKEPKRVHQDLKDPSWIEAMQEELLQFKMQKVWILVDLPYGKRAIGHTQEEDIDYKEVFAPVARIEAIRLFLAYASFMGFLVYQMDVKSAFLYGTIEEEVYVCQPLGFEDPKNPDKVYKVVKALYGLHQASRACQDKYVAEILRKFGLSEGKSASTLIDAEKPLLKDSDAEDVDVHTY
nr:hypothetical protein [Tanacetum cinerariifolium]